MAPSLLLRIDDAYTAFVIDQAVYVFGAKIEARIEQAQRSTGKQDSAAKQAWRAEDVLRRSLGIQRKFASPAPTM